MLHNKELLANDGYWLVGVCMLLDTVLTGLVRTKQPLAQVYWTGAGRKCRSWASTMFKGQSVTLHDTSSVQH